MTRTTIRSEDVTAGQITSADITDGTIVNADINASAAIVQSKLATLAIDTAELAADAVTPAKMADSAYLANRNIIINGNFDVWQRGTSFAAIANAAYSADRFMYEKTGAMVHTITRDADVPTQAQSGTKSLYSLKVDCTTVDASIAAGDFCQVLQRIEGYNYSQLEGNTGTLSFWVKATKTGTYCISVRSGGSDRSYVAEYTVSSSDTWEKKTISITFNYSGGTWGYGTGIGLVLLWSLAAGSNYQGTADQWNSAQDFATSNQVNACDNTSNNFFLSQVQLEVSPTATPFEHKSYGQKLADCQRYYSKSYNPDVAPATSQAAGACSSLAIFSSGSQSLGARWVTSMRTAPTVVIYPPGSTNTGYVQQTSNNVEVAAIAGDIGMGGFQYLQGSLPTSNANGVRFHWSADAEL